MNYWRNSMPFPPHRPPLGMPPLHPGLLPPGFAMPPMGAPMMPLGIGLMPGGPTHLGLMPGGPMMPPGVPMPMPDARGPPPKMMNRKLYHPNQIIQKQIRNDEGKAEDGTKLPTTTVFVGNISERASDNMVRLMLNRCGNVVSWKRVQGASGKLQAFGFCEFADPESSLRAIRLLHDFQVADKKLVVKVDAKTKAQLDEYKAAKKAKLSTTDSTKDSKENKETKETKDNEEELDEHTLRDDRMIKAGLDAIIRDHQHELNQPPPEDTTERNIILPETPNVYEAAAAKLQAAKFNYEKQEKKLSKTQEALLKLSKTGDKENDKESRNDLDEMDLEEDKKNLISREIRSFRDTYQKDEEGREKDRDRRDRDRDRERERERERDRERTRREKEREKERNKEKDRRKDRERSREISRGHSRGRSRDHSRSRSREQSSDRERSRSRDRDQRERDREVEREREREEVEEAYERKKIERKLREKEAAYQEHLRNWEAHERKKMREHDKEREKDDERRSEEFKEAKRLKEFLEDYDDERDDPKYYKGSALARRMKEREKEIEGDNRDRQREKEEIEEIRQRLLAEGHPDPNAEVARLEKEREEHMQPRLKIEIVEEKKPTMRPITLQPIRSPHNSPPSEDDSHPGISVQQKRMIEDESTQNSFSSVSELLTPKDEPKAKPLGFTGLKLGSANSPSQNSNSKRKKLIIGDVFNMNEDEDSSDSSTIRKRKLVPLEYTEEEMKAVGQHSTTAEEKRKSIKSLIDKIPTAKDELFAYTIDWAIVDNNLMERRIKPWINKKIVEYIGEEEPTLVDFICSKVMAHSSPKSILDDVSMVLDEEAEVFVVKMWRLLIYEIEAKKAGLVK